MPAEQIFLAAVAESMIDQAHDNTRSVIQDHGNVVFLSGLDETFVGTPGNLLTRFEFHLDLLILGHSEVLEGVSSLLSSMITGCS